MRRGRVVQEALLLQFLEVGHHLLQVRLRRGENRAHLLQRMRRLHGFLLRGLLGVRQGAELSQGLRFSKIITSGYAG